MKRYAAIACMGMFLLGLSHAARAQGLAVGAPENPDQTIVEGAGVKVGEGTVLHPSVGAETGYVSNVFYTNNNVESSPILRVIAEITAASLSEQRMQSTDPDIQPGEEGDLQWHAGARIIGQEYLSTNDRVDAQHNIAGGLNAHGVVFPHRTWQFAFDEDYVRDTRPTNFESSNNLDRDINNIALALIYGPQGRALSGMLRYTNRIDVFESSTDAFANRMQNQLALRVNWQWLPITKIFGEVSFGLFGGLGNSSTKVSSYPLRVNAGIQTAITVDTALNLQVGYANAFYSTGESFNNVTFRSQLAWRYLPNGQLFAGYFYDFSDSVQANYFRDHGINAGLHHQIGDRFIMSVVLDARLRGYRGVLPSIMGPPDRDDALVNLGISPRYYFRDWFAATFDYDLLVDSTDYRYVVSGQSVNPSFVRHQVMAGVRATW